MTWMSRLCASRCEMGPLSQIQVGEYIIQHGGTEGNFALHMDGASSEGRELSAFVLGHRPVVETGEASRINNLLIDINWAMDKTSATRARDFKTICQNVAALCKKVCWRTHVPASYASCPSLPSIVHLWPSALYCIRWTCKIQLASRSCARQLR